MKKDGPFIVTYEIGEWEIRYGKRDGQFDVSKKNLHYYCCNSLDSAVAYILQAQGWNIPNLDKVALDIANNMDTIKV